MNGQGSDPICVCGATVHYDKRLFVRVLCPVHPATSAPGSPTVTYRVR